MRDRDEDEEPEWKTPREPVAEDFGAFAMLAGVLSEETRTKDVGAELGSEEKFFDAIRTSVEQKKKVEPAARPKVKDVDAVEMRENEYWSGKAEEAEEYIRDIAYGGVDGLAYLRSLAEFVQPPESLEESTEPPAPPALGIPLAQYVSQNIFDPLTSGRHGILTAISHYLDSPETPLPESISSIFSRSLAVTRELADLRRTLREKLDMRALIRQAEELVKVEEMWTGKAYLEEKRREREREREPEGNAAEYLQYAIQKHQEGLARPADDIQEDGEMLQYVLEIAANAIEEEARKRRIAGLGMKHSAAGEEAQLVQHASGAENEQQAGGGADSSAMAMAKDEEGAAMKELRLNLLALAKRAPLDQICALPVDLVPVHLRSIVPTSNT